MHFIRLKDKMISKKFFLRAFALLFLISTILVIKSCTIDGRLNCLPWKHKQTFLEQLYEDVWKSPSGADWQILDKWFPDKRVHSVIKTFYEFDFHIGSLYVLPDGMIEIWLYTGIGCFSAAGEIGYDLVIVDKNNEVLSVRGKGKIRSL
jgi:hypothetical protein